MKKRRSDNFRVAYGFGGRLQDDLEMYQGFMEVASPRGWRMLVLPEHFETRLRRLLDAGVVDAVVGDFISELWLRGLPGDVPAVHMGDRPLESEGVSSVVLDWREIGRVAGDHLRETGYGERWVYAPLMPEGVLEGMAEVEGGEPEGFRTRDELGDRLKSARRPGVFCLSDFYARRGIQLARHNGVRIPEDAGFLGLGDRFWDGVVAETGISSIPVPRREAGRMAATLLAERLEGRAARVHRLRPGVVRARQSTRSLDDAGTLRIRVEGVFQAQLADPPPIDDLARNAGMSRRSFETAFARETGQTPYAFLLGMREAEARRLLRETDWTVGRIGAEVGMPDPPAFSAFFKRRTGKSPSDWRGGALSGSITLPEPAKTPRD